jgi:hypothetical protein
MKDDPKKENLSDETDDSEETIRALQDFILKYRVAPNEVVEEKPLVVKHEAENSDQSGFTLGFKKYIQITLMAVILSLLSGFGEYGFKEGLLAGPAMCGLIYQWFYVIPLGLYFLIISSNKKQGLLAIFGVLTGAVLFALYGLAVMLANFDPFYNFPA